jgi:hypothetical protein
MRVAFEQVPHDLYEEKEETCRGIFDLLAIANSPRIQIDSSIQETPNLFGVAFESQVLPFLLCRANVFWCGVWLF